MPTASRRAHFNAFGGATELTLGNGLKQIRGYSPEGWNTDLTTTNSASSNPLLTLDLGVWTPSTGTWSIMPAADPGTIATQQWGTNGDIPVPGDYDGDGKTDYAVWRPSNGIWYVIPSSNPGTQINYLFGINGDQPAVGDYDADHKADYSVFRPSNATWFVLPSSTGVGISQQIGQNGDIPVPGDYDGDGKTDYAVWRPSNGTFYVIPSSNPSTTWTQQWGQNGDVPVPGDYDGDGKTDYAVWRPSNGVWYIVPSTNPSQPITYAWGANGDKPVPADYDGDGITDYAIWRPSNTTWYIVPSSSPSQSIVQQFGSSGDVPVPGHYGVSGTFYNYRLAYAPDGNVLNANDSVNGNWNFAYDDLNRLSSTTGTQSLAWTYDRYGNRWQQNYANGQSAGAQFTFNGANNHIDGYSYDTAGNLLSDGVCSYTYDAENRIIRVGGASCYTTGATYTYDAESRRVKQVAGSTSLENVFDLGGNGTPMDLNHNYLFEEVYLGGLRVATYKQSGLSYPLLDWLGNERMRTDTNGNVLRTCTNWPFGDNLTCTDNDEGWLHFTGQRDTETGLDHFWSRHYSSAQPRWLSPDPGGLGVVDPGSPQSWNRYAYVLNNPLTLADPLGLDCSDWVSDAECPRSDSNTPGGQYAHGGGGGGGGYDGLGDAPWDSMNSVTGLSSYEAWVNAIWQAGGQELSGDNVDIAINWSIDGGVYGVNEQTGDIVSSSALSELVGNGTASSINPFKGASFPIGGAGASTGGGAASNGGNSAVVCEGKVLSAINGQFGTSFTKANITNEFQFSTGAPPGHGTLNLNISGGGVSVGRYPVNWWSYVIGYGSTLHIPAGPAGLDSSSTLIFSNRQFTAHLDSAFSYNPFGALFHWLIDVNGTGGYKACP